jgi:hypothetical protein
MLRVESFPTTLSSYTSIADTFGNGAHRVRIRREECNVDVDSVVAVDAMSVLRGRLEKCARRLGWTAAGASMQA